MNNDNSCSSLTLAASATASSFTHGGSSALTVTGGVTVNQPTVNTTTTSWSINAGSATVGGSLNIGGSNTGTNRIAQVVVTTGTLTVSTDLVFNSSATTANLAVLSLSGAATVHLGGSLTLTNATGTLSPGTTSTFDYNGTGAQTVKMGTSAITYANLNINNTNASGASLGGAITAAKVTGNISVGTA